jgi:hypothetical protein
MNSEIEDIKKRVEAVEYAVRWTMDAFCTNAYNYFLTFLKGEEKKAYVDFWKPKLDTLHKDVKAAVKLEKVMDLVSSFCADISEYALALKVDTADKAMEIAHSFIKKYSPVALPLKAVKERDVWLVDIDVGALAVKIAKVKVDAKTGDILSYEIPEKK